MPSITAARTALTSPAPSTGSVVKIQGLSTSSLSASRKTEAHAKALLKANEGVMVKAGHSLVNARDLKAMLESPRKKAFLFDLAHSLGGEKVTSDWAHTPSGGKAVRPLKASEVYAYLLKGLQLPQSLDRNGKETPASKETRQKAEVHLHAVVDEMLKKPNATFYAAEWNNQDDTNMFCVIAVSTTTNVSDVSMLKIIPAI